MDNKRRLEEFFRLENERAWKEYEAFLAPEIKWTLYSLDKWISFYGKDAYMNKMLSVYHGNSDTFSCVEMRASADGNRIVATLENSGGGVSIDIFDFRNGLIVCEWEYLMN